MADDALPTLLTALDIVAFESLRDGGFRSLSSPPPWFARLSQDGTFPFLGHILEEAQAFWKSRAEGVRQWGPCVGVAEDGREFHYLVKALNIQARPYLVIQLDESAERIRDVLQKVRGDALAAAQQKER
jgi:hypothetical protein